MNKYLRKNKIDYLKLTSINLTEFFILFCIAMNYLLKFVKIQQMKKK